jgi:hypothetical protein
MPSSLSAKACKGFMLNLTGPIELTEHRGLNPSRAETAIPDTTRGVSKHGTRTFAVGICWMRARGISTKTVISYFFIVPSSLSVKAYEGSMLMECVLEDIGPD